MRKFDCQGGISRDAKSVLMGVKEDLEKCPIVIDRVPGQPVDDWMVYVECERSHWEETEFILPGRSIYIIPVVSSNMEKIVINIGIVENNELMGKEALYPLEALKLIT